MKKFITTAAGEASAGKGTSPGPTSAAARRAWADQASAIGAGGPGMGLGVLWAAPLRPYAAPLLLSGVLLHGWGMLDRHRRREKANEAPPAWSVLVYALCWLALALLLLWISGSWHSGKG